jgi:hypothetical protein
MAVTRTGTYASFNAAQNTGSGSITIPSDATIIVCGVGGWTNDVNPNNTFASGNITVGGNTLSKAVSFVDNTKGLISTLYYLVNPPTGSQTLAWDWNSTDDVDEGGQILCCFYKGVDTTDPIRSSSAVAETSNYAYVTSANLAATTGDAVFSYSVFYVGYITGIAWTNATEIVEMATYNSQMVSIAEAFPNADLTVTATRYGTTDWSGLAAVVLKAGTVGATSLPILPKNFSHLLVR